MPLNSGCSLSAFRANVAKLVGEGYPNKQAVAVAADTLKQSCSKLKQPVPDIGELIPPDWDDSPVEAPCCGAELDPDLDGKKADFPFRPTGIWGVFDYKR